MEFVNNIFHVFIIFFRNQPKKISGDSTQSKVLSFSLWLGAMPVNDMVATLLHTVSSHAGDVNCVAFKDDLLATCSGDKTVRLWNTDDYSEHPSSPLCGHTYSIHCCMFAPNGNTLTSCSTDGKVIFWDTKTGEKTGVLEHKSKSSIRVCRFSPDSTCFATGSDDETLCLWDVASRKQLR